MIKTNRIGTVYPALGLALAACATASAQWTVVDLHSPEWGANSAATGIDADFIVGRAFIDDDQHAILWNLTGAAWADLTPAGYPSARLFALHGDYQGGAVQDPAGFDRAGLWRGSAGLFVDLAQPWMTGSVVTGVSDTHQGGYWFPEANITSACAWTGTAASWVSLQPPGASRSVVYAVSGDRQGGNVTIDSHQYASLWSGTAGSWVNLNPPASLGSSSVSAMYGDEQYGYAGTPYTMHAGKWSGAAASWVDLNPPGAHSSWVTAAGNGVQVGGANIPNFHAVLWRGTANSWVDLETLLPAGYRHAIALGVWSDGTVIRVVGSAQPPLASPHAMMWTFRPPTSDFNGDGFIDFFDFDAFVACFEGIECPDGKTADFNPDGFVDFEDFADFVTAFEAGS